MSFFNHHMDCEICGKSQHANQLDTVTREYEFTHGGSLKVNVNYCLGENDCFKAAVKKAEDEIALIQYRYFLSHKE